MAPVDLSKEYAFGGITSLGEGFTYLMGPAFQLAAILMIIWFLVGIFLWIISGGDKEKVAQARNKMTHSIIGFILLIFLFLVVQYLPEALGLSGYKIIR